MTTPLFRPQAPVEPQAPFKPRALFRPQALDQQGSRQLAVATGLNPVALSLLCWLLVSLVLMAVFFLVTGQFPRSVEVGGVLVANHGTIDIKAPVNGIVGNVQASTGDRVEKGRLLLQLHPDNRQVNGKSVALAQLSQNRVQQTLLETRQSALKTAFGLKLDQARSRQEALGERVQELTALVGKEAAILALEQSRHARLQQLHTRHLVAVDSLEQAAMAVLKQEKVVLRSRHELEDKQRQLHEIDEEQALLQSEFKQEMTELALRQADLAAREAGLGAEVHQEVTAPVTGTITLMRVKAGESVSAGQMLGSLQHAESRLQAELYIPSSAVGFLASRQNVSLQLDAFPYQKFGMVNAQLSEVAGSVVSVGSESGRGGHGAFYLAKAELAAQDILGFGEHLPLRAGMELRAKIELEQRSLLEWLFEPLLVNGRLAIGQ